MIPSMTPVLLKYHTVAPERIVAATLRDLAASGIPERALGRISAARRVTLVACTVLNDHARSYLPASLGGAADGLDASDDTLSLAGRFLRTLAILAHATGTRAGLASGAGHSGGSGLGGAGRGGGNRGGYCRPRRGGGRATWG